MITNPKTNILLVQKIKRKKEKKKGKEVRERRETREFSKSAELFNEEIKISLSPAKRQRRARVVEWLFTRPEKW